MQKEVSIYEINCDFKNNKVYFKNKTKIGILNFNYDYNYDDIQDKILSYDEEYKNIYDKMKLDEIYYIVEEDPWNIVGVISLHKGYTFIDCADHDDRVIIKSAFPNKQCNIIGE
jgi:hypothetical protein